MFHAGLGWKMKHIEFEKLTEDLHCCTLPQPFFEDNKIYIFSGPDGCIIDGGHPQAFTMLSNTLEQNTMLERTGKFYYTHPHIDHVGPAIVSKKGSDCWQHFIFQGARPAEAWWNESRIDVHHMVRKIYDEVPEFTALYNNAEVENFVNRFFPETDTPQFTGGLKAGQKIELRDDIIHVIHTPGHNPYHVCLYFEKRGYLFSGDMILRGGGTSIINEMGDDHDVYLDSLSKLEQLEACLVLPGHGKPFYSAKDAVKRARRFHFFMKNSILRILQEPMSCYEIAYKLFKNHLNSIEIAFIGCARIRSFLQWLEAQGQVENLSPEHSFGLATTRYRKIP